MIVAAALCPPAPLLIPRLADRLAADLDELVTACRRSLAPLAAVGRIAVVSVGTGLAADRRLEPGTPVSAAAFSRSDHPVAPVVRLPVGPAPVGYDDVHAPAPVAGGAGERATLSEGTIVAAYLLHAAGIDTPTVAYQVGPGTDPAAAAAAITAGLDATPAGLLVMANGAAAHSEHAPGGQDPRAAGFDERLVMAVRSGDPAELARTCRDVRNLAAELHDETLPALAALAELTKDNGAAAADLLHYSAPLGIGYLVGTWQWAPAA